MGMGVDGGLRAFVTNDFMVIASSADAAMEVHRLWTTSDERVL